MHSEQTNRRLGLEFVADISFDDEGDISVKFVSFGVITFFFVFIVGEDDDDDVVLEFSALVNEVVIWSDGINGIMFDDNAVVVLIDGICEN